MPTTVARGRIRAGSQQGNHSVDGREEPYVVNRLEERGITAHSFGRVDVAAMREQFCGVSNCKIPFPIDKGFCDEDCWKQCGDGSDGGGATGLGFLTAAAAVAAAL